jgi:hypothetical protein
MLAVHLTARAACRPLARGPSPRAARPSTGAHQFDPQVAAALVELIGDDVPVAPLA